MSHKTVQQIVVRMLFDPVFVDSIYSNSALANDPLDDEQRRWLTAVDRRVWGADPLRRTRSLHALIEEFPVSVTLGASVVGGVAELDGFFSSNRFHDCVRGREFLVTGFAAWLRDLSTSVASPWSHSLRSSATIEEAMATVRRAQMPPVVHIESNTFQLTPLAALVDVYSGALKLIGDIRAVIGPHETAVKSLLANRIVLDHLQPVDPDDTQHVLVLRMGHQSGEITLEELSSELAVLLRIAKTPTTTELLAATVIEMGAGPQDALEILEGFLEDQLLLPCGPTVATTL